MSHKVMQSKPEKRSLRGTVGKKAEELGTAKRPRGRKRPTDPAELAAHEAKKAADKAKRTKEYEDPDNIWASFGMDGEELSGDALVKSKVLTLVCHPLYDASAVQRMKSMEFKPLPGLPRLVSGWPSAALAVVGQLMCSVSMMDDCSERLRTPASHSLLSVFVFVMRCSILLTAESISRGSLLVSNSSGCFHITFVGLQHPNLGESRVLMLALHGRGRLSQRTCQGPAHTRPIDLQLKPVSNYLLTIFAIQST